MLGCRDWVPGLRYTRLKGFRAKTNNELIKIRGIRQHESCETCRTKTL